MARLFEGMILLALDYQGALKIKTHRAILPTFM